MSFVTQEDIIQLSEEMLLQVLNGVIEEFKLDKKPIRSFTRLTYDEALHFYGCDKPDLRFDLRLFDVTDVVRDAELGVFRNVAETGGMIRGIRYPGGAKLSRREIAHLEEYCKEFGAKGMAYLLIESGISESGYSSPSGLYAKGPLAKFFKPEEMNAIFTIAQAEPGDLLCFIADSYMQGNNILYRLRNKIGDQCGLRDPRILNFCWITDFPLVEWDEEAQRWQSIHHPFTGPKFEDLIYIDTNPEKIRAECYDVVCNGLECASGSIRIHRPDIQARIFKLLGIDEDVQRERFGHILQAFHFGAPPHGGIAPGIDRLTALLTGDEHNIREVIAFPKIAHGHDPLMNAPSPIETEQWQELGLKLAEPYASMLTCSKN
jgi:aspartyl-tRNA synthetase